MKSVLLSLKPQWWELMKTGEKTLEIRKSRPRDIDLPARVLVYLPKPEGRIVGEFLVGHFVKTDKVGGLIETVTLAEDCCLICNEEYRYNDSEFNMELFGIDFFGTILMVGVKGEEFADLEEEHLRFGVKMMGGRL